MKRIAHAVLLLFFALPITFSTGAAEKPIADSKKKLIRELLKLTEAQEGTADAILDILGGRLGIPMAQEEARGEVRESRQVTEIAEHTLVPIYDRYFNERQLRHLIAFFKTETGEHFVEVARKIAVETRKNLQAETIRRMNETAEVGRTTRTRNDFQTLGAALNAYFTEHRTYPKGQNISELAALLSPQYMPTVPQVDAWGRSLQYEVSGDGQHYRIVSAGIDGKFAPSEQAHGDDIVYSDGRFLTLADPKSGR